MLSIQRYKGFKMSPISFINNTVFLSVQSSLTPKVIKLDDVYG